MRFAAAWRHWRALLRFGALPARQRQLVIYSEGASSWPHLGPVLHALLDRQDMPVTYVSSAPDDPGVALQHPLLSTHVIGEGLMRTVWFRGLRAGLLLMTMPDLENFHIRRSPHCGCYAYLHHSLVSCHMVYREGAFDHFDAMLCAGPHHVQEMKAIDALRGRPAKQLVAHGYGRLDTLLAGAVAAQPMHVVIAPSWGPEGLLERHAEALLQALAGSGWQVTIRPHPQTRRLAPEAMATIRAWCARVPSLRLDDGVAGHAALQSAEVMVSDWSGAAFDFALGLERPVLFIDVPRKVNNPHHADVGIEPIEVFGRAQIGSIIDVDALPQLPRHLAALAAAAPRHRDAIREFRSRWVYHPGRSAQAAADWLVRHPAAGPAP